MSSDTAQHTPFSRARYANGGALSCVYVRRGGFRYGPEAVDWTCGPKGPGCGVIADCSPNYPATEETITDAKIFAAVPDLIGALEACNVKFPAVAARGDEAHPSKACARAISVSDFITFRRTSDSACADVQPDLDQKRWNLTEVTQ